jgi:uncharacterized protein YrrD
MGVSILSLVEIFYYLTLRLACNVNYQRRHRKIRAREISSIIDDEAVNKISSQGLRISKPNFDMEKSD